MRYRVYRENKYSNRRIKTVKKFLKRVVVGTILGTVVICGANMIGAKADDKVVNESIKIESYDTGSGIDFKNVDNLPVQSDTEITTEESSNNIDSNENILNVGSDSNKSMVIDYLYGPIGQYIYKYSEEYGVDPNIIAAMAMQETALDHNACIPGGEMYSGYGVGLLQLESPSGQEITAYNYKTGEYDTEYITMDNACDIVTNIKIGCMIFQNSLNNNNGNILLAIQSHNYGQPMVDMILDNMYGNDIDSIKKDYSNIEWLSAIKEAHINPSVYLSDWLESSYGDGNYIENVLRFCPSNEIKYKYDNNEYTYDLINLKVTNVSDYNASISK